MMEIQPVPSYLHYDAPGVFYFEVYPNGDVRPVSNKIRDVDRKADRSVFGSYSRIKNGECTLYLSAVASESESIVYRVDDPEALADSFGILRPSEHTHDIHAALSPEDTGTGRYAKIEIDFRCGCTLSSHNSRSMKSFFRDKFGWELILNSINSERLSKRTVSVERNSLSKTQLPF